MEADSSMPIERSGMDNVCTDVVMPQCVWSAKERMPSGLVYALTPSHHCARAKESLPFTPLHAKEK